MIPRTYHYRKKSRNLAYAEGKGLELLLDCDANSHHIRWGKTNINAKDENLLNFMYTDLISLNKELEPPFMDYRRQKIIDITILSKKLARLESFWRIL